MERTIKIVHYVLVQPNPIMKIPEPLFAIINPAMRLLLRSPLHALMSRSLTLITFKGRTTGRTYTIPLRYVQDGATIRCYTSRDAKWWRNLKHEPPVILRIRGRDLVCSASVIDDNPATIRELLAGYLAQHPGDAVYHNVRLARNRTPVPEDLDRAGSHSIIVEATPLPE